MMGRRSLFLCAVLAGLSCGRTERAESAGDVVGDGARRAATGVATSTELARAVAADTALAAAQRALTAGHPWRATRILAPVLRDAKRRTPSVVLLAARAADGWEGYTEVDRLLSRESWLDSRFNGEGRELLAKSALARNADSAAVEHARAAVTQAADARTRAMRMVLLARALDRRNQLDSARASYERAAAGLRDASDWLRLRAAGVDADSSRRAADYARVHVPAARDRIAWTEAQALERTGDVAAAARAFAALGAPVSALRLRLSQPSDSVGRAQIKSELIRIVRTRSGTGDARQAVELLDKYVSTPVFALTPDEDLLVARSALASGPVARAVTGFARADSAGLVGDVDRMRYADALARSGRSRDALAQYDRVGGSRKGDAAYQRARLLLDSNGSAARKELERIIADFPRDTSASVASLYLLADLRTDDGQDEDAQRLFEQLYSRFPGSSRADDARFRAGMISYVKKQPRTAALRFDSLVALHPNAGESMAARYWSGKAWAAAGNTATARQRWHDAIAKESASYYASASARKLGQPAWTPAPGPAAFPHNAAVDSAMRRIKLLEALGMDVEARFEYEALEAAAPASMARLVATATAMRDNGQTSRAIRLAWKAVERGSKNATTYRLAYPIVDREQLVAQSKAKGLDPALVAGLIRQESNFYPHATSAPGARGLMQVMPPVGEQIARRLGFPIWDPGLLYDADANLEIGTSHLASSLKEYDALPFALAAYNAGGSRVKRWTTKDGTEDPEIFIERIPFVETRDYVRIVQRNAELYRALYNLK